jgi:hypothetical protein
LTMAPACAKPALLATTPPGPCLFHYRVPPIPGCHGGHGPERLVRGWWSPEQEGYLDPEVPYLLHAFTTGQEEHSKPESSAAKLYSLHLQEQECKRARALLLTSLGAREQEREWRNPVPFKENYPPPRTCHSLIGCSPSAELSSRGRQSTWGGELPLAHAQIICLPLRTQDVSAILQRRMWGRLPTGFFCVFFAATIMRLAVGSLCLSLASVWI